MKKKLLALTVFLTGALAPVVTYAAPTSSWTTIFGTTCSTYDCWIKQVWNWAMGIAVSLSVIVIVIAGVIWMTSAGSPDRIGSAKKMILGAISGLALLVLARVFLNTLGLGRLWIF